MRAYVCVCVCSRALPYATDQWELMFNQFIINSFAILIAGSIMKCVVIRVTEFYFDTRKNPQWSDIKTVLIYIKQ